MNICLCGAQDGYPHLPECPFPYYGNDVIIMQKWVTERLVRMQALATPAFSRIEINPADFPQRKFEIHVTTICPRCGATIPKEKP